MKFSAELVSESTAFFDQTSYVEMWAEYLGQPVEGTYGRDDFTFVGAVLPWRRVCGLGRIRRNTVFQYSGGLGLGVFEVDPSGCFEIPLDGSSDFRLRVRTNIVRNKDEFVTGFAVRLAVDGSYREFPLRALSETVERLEDGSFAVDLSWMLEPTFRSSA